ncbi:MAG: autoinducer binding domain-containing protein [Xanthomonadaceae bacterium]|nr:autoinducer binding domain-containing protein [Xanthomonadaceae bacterium]
MPPIVMAAPAGDTALDALRVDSLHIGQPHVGLPHVESFHIDSLQAQDRQRCVEYDKRLRARSDRDTVSACVADIREWLDLEEVLLLNSSLYYSDQHIIATGHDTAWLGLYVREGFAYVDPIVNAIARGHRFFPRRPLIQWQPDRAIEREPPSPNPLFRRLIEAAKDFKRPAYGYAGGEVVGGRFLLLSAPSRKSCADDRRLHVLNVLFPSLMRALARQPAASQNANLSGRETRMLELLAEGLSDAEIADNLAISQATVRFHLQNLFQKLQARNRCHVIALAYRHGYLSPN